MIADPLASPKLKIQRAHRHIEDVVAQINSFFRTELYPIAHWIKDHDDGLHQLLQVQITRPIPGEIAAATGDVIGNLRSALDHLTRCLAIQNHAAMGLPGQPKKTYFPIAGDLNEFQTWGTQKKVEPLSQDAKDLIASLKPYKGGNDLLWALNSLRNLDIHNALVPIGAASLGGQTSMVLFPGRVGELTFEAPRFMSFDENQTATLLKFPRPLGQPNYDLEITVDVALGDVEVLRGQLLTTTLQQFAGLAESIVLFFERRFFMP